MTDTARKAKEEMEQLQSKFQQQRALDMQIKTAIAERRTVLRQQSKRDLIKYIIHLEFKLRNANEQLQA